MKLKKIIFRDIVYYATDFTVILCAVILATSVLLGALLTGDSINTSLKYIVDLNLGKTRTVINNNQNLFNTDLQNRINSNKQLLCSSILLNQSFIDEKNKNKQVNIFGVTNVFFRFALEKNNIQIPDPGNIYINKKTAHEFDLKKGDYIVLNLIKPSLKPAESIITDIDKNIVKTRVKITKIIGPQNLGDFSLNTTQYAQYNGFVDNNWLNAKLGLTGKSNLMLFDKNDTQFISNQIKHNLKFNDLSIKIKKYNHKNILANENFFFKDTTKNTIEKIYNKKQINYIFTWFINSGKNSNQEESVNYIFISGIQNNLIQEFGMKDLNDNEIIIADYIAEKLKLKINDKINLKYYKVQSAAGLIEEQAEFIIKKIVDIEHTVISNKLSPEFPGLTDVEYCTQWDPSIPINLDFITEQDKQLWKKYGAAPRMFISFKKAQKLWKNRFGNFTGIILQNKLNINEFKQNFIKKINPVDLGFHIFPVYNIARENSEKAIDFKGLFSGLSMFVIISAIILLSLIINLYIEKRNNSITLFKVIGFNNSQIKQIFFRELIVVIIAGILTGLVTGTYITKFIMYSSANTSESYFKHP